MLIYFAAALEIYALGVVLIVLPMKLISSFAWDP